MEFQHSFRVDAPIRDVIAFHNDTSALKKLTPFPIIAQIHEYEPLAEGSNARFTLWFGPFPVRWHAVHSNVSDAGFTDLQISGPLKSWRHNHRFTPDGNDATIVRDEISYEHDRGLRGLISRLLFNRPGLLYLFFMRKVLTRRGIQRLGTAAHSGAIG